MMTWVPIAFKTNTTRNNRGRLRLRDSLRETLGLGRSGRGIFAFKRKQQYQDRPITQTHMNFRSTKQQLSAGPGIDFGDMHANMTLGEDLPSKTQCYKRIGNPSVNFQESSDFIRPQKRFVKY